MKNLALISLSNPLDYDKNITTIKEIKNKLKDFNIYESKCIYEKAISYDGKTKAKELMNLYLNDNIDAIFDVSGGDLANETLEYVDFDTIKNHPKPFFGFSDLSVYLNSLYSKSKLESHWFQLRSIVYDNTNKTLNDLIDYLNGDNKNLLDFQYEWLQGNKMQGVVVGGNLRCTLKLAGTTYLPSFKDKLVLIESYGGDIKKIKTYLTQYKQMGVFNECAGIILGTFTEMEENNSLEYVTSEILKIIDNKDIPIIKTQEIGHSPLSKSIVIGREYNLQ
ncbi:MAG: LD-carboxypeptidase [Clostridiaceae bacterium]|nr:LD-carboxypeptidase [Clostridiaceae bacterium]